MFVPLITLLINWQSYFILRTRVFRLFFYSCPLELCNETQYLLLISLDTLIPPCFTSIFELFFPLYPQQHESLLELFASKMQVHLFNVALVQALNLKTFSPNGSLCFYPASYLALLYILEGHKTFTLPTCTACFPEPLLFFSY